MKALVDNTLGRLWVQMHPDSSLRASEPPPLPAERTADTPVADYLVPRTGEKIRFQRVAETGEAQTWKRACDITLLDPACGTMHFGQYAFGLFHRMYLDEIDHAGQEGWPAEPSVAQSCPPSPPPSLRTTCSASISIRARFRSRRSRYSSPPRRAALRDGLLAPRRAGEAYEPSRRQRRRSRR